MVQGLPFDKVLKNSDFVKWVKHDSMRAGHPFKLDEGTNLRYYILLSQPLPPDIQYLASRTHHLLVAQAVELHRLRGG